jgi:RNA polymerase sigma-70 factor (ECF subfamily)
MGAIAALPAPTRLQMAAAGEDAAAAAGDVERDAIAACRRGEREAFDVLVERYQRDVYRLCYRYLGNHEDANDMAQEAFLKAWRGLSSFRGDSAFSTWLYRITVNTCLNFRSARRPAGEEPSEALPDRRPSAAETLLRGERERQVQEAIERLPDKQRATLILRVYHELTHEEVARILGSTVGTVKANLFHAVSNLRRLMGGSCPPPRMAGGASGGTAGD